MEIREMTFGPRHPSDENYLLHQNKVYTITKFQRPYTWGKFQLDGIFQDISYVLQSDEDVGWPSMLVQESSAGSMSVKNYDLGDGQQRTTSVFLILAAIWHQWRKEYLASNTAQHTDFFDRLFRHGVGDEGRGILGGETLGVIETAISFQTPKTRGEIENLFKTPIMTEDVLSTLRTHLDDATEDRSLLYANFIRAWDELNIIAQSEQDLVNIGTVLLTKIVFPVVVYTEQENMFRAFANINSFGEPLTQSELVKAEVYGRVKSVDRQLADRIADQWNEHMEPWFREHTSSGMDWFLKQEFNIFSNWQYAGDRLRVNDSVEKHRFLKMRWQEYFDSVAEQFNHDESLLRDFYEHDFYDKLQKHYVIAKYLISRKEHTVGSVEWEMQYTYKVFDNLQASVLFYLRDNLSDRELIKTLRLMRRFAMYAYFRKTQSTLANVGNIFFKIGSPIRQYEGHDLTYEKIEEFLVEQGDGGTAWLSASEIEEILKDAVYGTKYTQVFGNLFAHINNETFIDNKYLGEQKNPAYLKECTREHIISQKPLGLNLSAGAEEDEYNRYVNRLGNVLVLYRHDNSSAGNRNVGNKIATYQKSENTLWGMTWVRDFIDDYNKNSKLWDDPKQYREAIDQRSAKLAKLIAPYISRPNDDGTTQEEDSKTAGKILSITVSDNKGNVGSDTTITGAFTEYLEQFVEDPKVREQIKRNEVRGSVFALEEQQLVLVKDLGYGIGVKGARFFTQEKMDVIIEEINTRFEGYTAQIVVERAEVDDDIEEEQDEAFENDSEYDDIVDFAVRAPFEELLKVINK